MEGADLVALQKNRYWQSGGGLSFTRDPSSPPSSTRAGREP
jgi:hypothetical protein